MNSNSLHELLEAYRTEARTEREKGTYFERLAAAYLSEDPVQREHYEKVQTYSTGLAHKAGSVAIPGSIWSPRCAGRMATPPSSASSTTQTTGSERATLTASCLHRGSTPSRAA